MSSTSSKTTTFYFIRHGLVENPSHIIYGRLPRYALSEKGIKDARRAAEILKNIDFGAFYSSPLLRTRQTAGEILLYHKTIKLQKSSLITEVLTPFEGQPESILSRYGGDVYAHSGGEQPMDILQRSLVFIKRCKKKYSGKNIGAVTHGDVILFLLFWAAGAAVTAENKLQIPTIRPGNLTEYPATGSILTLAFQGDDAELLPTIGYHTDRIIDSCK